jgi:hypothetical protein
MLTPGEVVYATASSPTCPAAPLPRTSSNCAPASTPALGQSFHRRVHPHRCPRTPHLAHVATGPGRCRSSSPSWRSPSSTWTTAYPSTTTSCGRWGSTGGALRSDRPAGVGPGPEKGWHGVSRARAPLYIRASVTVLHCHQIRFLIRCRWSATDNSELSEVIIELLPISIISNGL